MGVIPAKDAIHEFRTDFYGISDLSKQKVPNEPVI
jgi:hypothetical protein